MRPRPCVTWLAPLLLALVTTALFAPPLARSATSIAALAVRPAVTPARSAYRTLLSISVVPCLLLGALGLVLYRRSHRPRHWHPRVGLLSPVQVLPSGELSQSVGRYIWPLPKRAANQRLD